MLRWLSSLTDSRPLGSVAGARKFAASLDRDVFVAAERVGELLREFAQEAEGEQEIDPAPLIELEQRVIELTQRLERDFLVASTQTHALRDRLWNSAYDWAMRFADAYRMVLRSAPAAPSAKQASGYSRAAISLFVFRAMGYRFRLYRHEEWIPGNWRELNQQFKRICELGIDHKSVSMGAGAEATYPARAYVALLLLRLGNAGGYMPSQTHLLWEKLYNTSFDIRLTARPSVEGGFVVDLSGSDGLQPKNSVPQGGHFLFCDTTASFQRLTTWLDQSNTAETEPLAAAAVSSVQALRSAVLRIDPEFKPLARASQRNSDRGRLAATYGLQRTALAAGYSAQAVLASIGGEAYGYADAQEIHTLGQVRDETMKRLKKALPPEASRIDPQFWHLRDRSDTGYRCEAANAQARNIRLRDIVLLTEDGDFGGDVGWQAAMVVRLLKLPAGHVELGLQVLSRELEAVDIRQLRPQPGAYGAAATLAVVSTFKALRLKAAFFGRPIMDQSWIMSSADYSAASAYEAVGTSRRYEAQKVVTEGADWVWVMPTEIVRQGDPQNGLSQ